MLFADTALVRRIEHAECRLTADVAEVIQARSSPGEVFVASIAGGIAAHVGADAPFNKMIGVGLDGPLDEAAQGALEAIEGEFTVRRAALQAEIATLAHNSVTRLLTGRGYALVGFENVLGLRLDEALASRLAAVPPPPGLTLVQGEGVERDAWIDTVLNGFAHPDAVPGGESHEVFPRDALAQVMSDMAQVSNFTHSIARLDGAIAGGAGLRTCGGVAQLCGSATLPEHRRRGVQTALLARRLLDATRSGCDVAVITTQPGSKSQQNAQRHGFALLYSRAILLREAPQGH
jgi:ribosomal protein S18 acetylase RimI-like enzyme